MHWLSGSSFICIKEITSQNINLKYQVTEKGDEGKAFSAATEGNEQLHPAAKGGPASVETSKSLSQMELGGPTPPRSLVIRHCFAGPRHITEALHVGGALPRDGCQQRKDMPEPAAWTPQDILPQDADPSASPRLSQLQHI